MAKARKVRGLEADTRFGDAAAAAVETRSSEVFEHCDGVLDTADIERVHDMRVATRRLRAALEVFAVCFPKQEYKRLLDDVKQLADALGERRDADVTIESLEEIGAALGKEAQAGIDGLVGDVRSEQSSANEVVSETLEQVRSSDLERRLAELAETARAEPAAVGGEGAGS